MRPLSAYDILKVWETGQDQHLPGRALTILSVACPDMRRDKLAALTVAQRDIILLDIREHTFGPILKGCAECPKCIQHLELTLLTTDIRTKQETEPFNDVHSLELKEHGLELSFHLPNSFDLAVIIGCDNAQSARNLLAQRCVLNAIRNGVQVSEYELSDEIINRLSDRMSECEPQSEVLLDLRCPACSHHWQMIFDIAVFLWIEISAQAKRLLREVHTLASAYKWREADILSMSPARRQYYIEMVS